MTDITQGLAAALSEFTQNMRARAAAKAAIAYLANVAPDAGPEPASPLPWKCVAGGVVADTLRGPFVETPEDREQNGQAIVHRVNGWPTLRAALEAKRVPKDIDRLLRVALRSVSNEYVSAERVEEGIDWLDSQREGE